MEKKSVGPRNTPLPLPNDQNMRKPRIHNDAGDLQVSTGAPAHSGGAPGKRSLVQKRYAHVTPPQPPPPLSEESRWDYLPPKEDSLWEERATLESTTAELEAEAGAAGDQRQAARAPRSANTARSQPRPLSQQSRWDILPPREDSLWEERATLESTAPGLEAELAESGGLDRRQVARAQRNNPRWATRLGFRPAQFGTSAGVDTAEFANAVAGFQADHDLTVDGIAGPNTHHALMTDMLETRPGPRTADVMEPGVLGEDDVLEPGLLGPDDVMEPGVLGEGELRIPTSRRAAHAPGRAWPSDVMEPGVLGEADVLEPGLLGPDDVMEPGVLGEDEVVRPRSRPRRRG